MPLPSDRGAKSMRIVPGSCRLSYQVATVLVPAESHALVVCWNVMLWYHLPAYRSCICRMISSPDGARWPARDATVGTAGATPGTGGATSAMDAMTPHRSDDTIAYLHLILRERDSRIGNVAQRRQR